MVSTTEKEVIDVGALSTFTILFPNKSTGGVLEVKNFGA